MLPLLPLMAVRGVASVGGVAGRVAGRIAGGSARTATRLGNTARSRLSLGAGASMAGASVANANNNANQVNSTMQPQQQQQSNNNANSQGGDLQSVINQLQEIQSNLQSTTQETNRLGKSLNKHLTEPLKKAKNALGGMLKTARNLVMAFGAMAIGNFFMNTKGQIEKHRNASQANVSNAELKAYNRARAMQGYKDDEFELSQLQSLIGSQDGYEVLARLGLNRDALAGLKGDEAMEQVKSAIDNILKQMPKNATIDPKLAEAIQATTGVDATNIANRKLFSRKERDIFSKEYKSFLKTIGDSSVLVESQKQIARLQYRIKDLGEAFAIKLAPFVNKVLDGINSFLSDTNNINGLGEVMSLVFDGINKAINKLSKVFTKDVIASALEGIGKVGSALLDITQKILPYFLEGIKVLGSLLEGIAQFLNNPLDFIQNKMSEFKEVGKELRDGLIARNNGFGKVNGKYDNKELDDISQFAQQQLTQRHQVEIVVKNENGSVLGEVTSNIGGNGR